MSSRSLISEIESFYRNGEWLPSGYVRGCLDEIARRDRGPDGLRSFITVADPSTLHLQAHDHRVSTRDQFRSLEGIPIAVKDNIDTVDLGCTAGSVLLEDVPVTSDAPVVSALRESGAVIIGKTNMSEWANFRSSQSSSGWSSVVGQTRHAESSVRTPCGSSSGSATAVAAGLVPVALGTETDGSIICPAATQGCVGFKPTIGRVPQDGIVPISWSQDTAGAITKTVTDAWIVEHVLERKNASEGVAIETELLPVPLKGMRIGVFTPGDHLHPEVRDLFRVAQRVFREAGAILYRIEPPASLSEIEAAELIVLEYEFPRAIAAYLTERRPASPYTSLWELHRANLEHKNTVLTLFGQEIWDRCLAETAPTEARYIEARREIKQRAEVECYDHWFGEMELDVIIAPANGPAWLIDHVNGDSYTGTATPPAAVTGNPVLTIPMGRVRGLPIGLGLYGPAHSDERLFRIGLTWERLNSTEAN